jgi:hypothetical protein
MISSSQNTICDVCRLLDYDCTKKLCGYCGLCDAFICSECSNRWDRRIRAAVKRKLEPGFKGDPKYTEKINEKGEWREEQ